MNDERTQRLAEHLTAASRVGDLYDLTRIAERILADPQALVDALVEAGAVRRGIDEWQGRPGPQWYYVVPPEPSEHQCAATAVMVGRTYRCERYRGHPELHYSLLGRLNGVQWPEGWQW